MTQFGAQSALTPRNAGFAVDPLPPFEPISSKHEAIEKSICVARILQDMSGIVSHSSPLGLRQTSVCGKTDDAGWPKRSPVFSITVGHTVTTPRAGQAAVLAS